VTKVDDASVVEVAATVLEATTDKDEEVEIAVEIVTTLEETAEVVTILETAEV